MVSGCLKRPNEPHSSLPFTAEPGDIIPMIYLPADAEGDPVFGITCDPIPSGSCTVSVLCPSLPKQFFDTPGTVNVNFVGITYIGSYQFSVTAMSTSTITVNTEATLTSTGTTTPGFTATATAYSRTVVERAGRKTVQGSCQKTTASGVFPSGSAYPSGNGSAPSGVFPTGIKPSGSGYYPPSGTAITPSGTGVSPPARAIYPSETAIKPSGSDIFPSGSRIPSGTGQSIYPLGTPSTPPPSSVIGPVYPTGTGPNCPSGTGSSAPFCPSGSGSSVQHSSTASLPLGSSAQSQAGPPATVSLSITYPFRSNSRSPSTSGQSHGTHRSHQFHGSHHTHHASLSASENAASSGHTSPTQG